MNRKSQSRNRRRAALLFSIGLLLALLSAASVPSARPLAAQALRFTPTPTAAAVSQTTINVNPDSGAQTVTFSPGTPITNQITLIAIISVISLVGLGARQWLGVYFDVKRNQAAIAARQQTEAIDQDAKTAEVKRQLELEDNRTAMQVQLEASKQQSSLISALTTWGTEQHRMNSVLESAFMGIAADRERSAEERAAMLKELQVSSERQVSGLAQQNSLIETQILTLNHLTTVTDTLGTRQSTLEKLLTEGETGTARKLGGQMNGIEERIQRLEENDEAMLALLVIIAQTVGVAQSVIDVIRNDVALPDAAPPPPDDASSSQLPGAEGLPRN